MKSYHFEGGKINCICDRDFGNEPAHCGTEIVRFDIPNLFVDCPGVRSVPVSRHGLSPWRGGEVRDGTA